MKVAVDGGSMNFYKPVTLFEFLKKEVIKFSLADSSDGEYLPFLGVTFL